ncbi:MAG TPA: hypothetical protein VGO43_10330 [Pyrinomonadaceae bacterium]|jgi:hypothetical protein|nr:hypothetical protein [Pyrinomonadaceae bacterium]
MSDETKKKDGEWSMPEPVFRSTEGRDVKAESDTPESEIPTEPADRDFTTEQSVNAGAQGVRSKANRRIRHQNKRKKSFLERNGAGIIVLVILLVGAVIYGAYFWLWRGGR